MPGGATPSPAARARALVPTWGEARAWPRPFTRRGLVWCAARRYALTRSSGTSRRRLTSKRCAPLRLAPSAASWSGPWPT